MYSDGMGVAFWPEYRGSMMREIIDIEDFQVQKKNVEDPSC